MPMTRIMINDAPLSVMPGGGRESVVSISFACYVEHNANLTEWRIDSFEIEYVEIGRAVDVDVAVAVAVDHEGRTAVQIEQSQHPVGTCNCQVLVGQEREGQLVAGPELLVGLGRVGGDAEHGDAEPAGIEIIARWSQE